VFFFLLITFVESADGLVHRVTHLLVQVGCQSEFVGRDHVNEEENEFLWEGGRVSGSALRHLGVRMKEPGDV
jgi:hypothetical protein